MESSSSTFSPSTHSVVLSLAGPGLLAAWGHLVNFQSNNSILYDERSLKHSLKPQFFLIENLQNSYQNELYIVNLN